MCFPLDYLDSTHTDGQVAFLETYKKKMIQEENHPPQPQFSAQRCRVKISKFNRERNRRVRLNWQCNRLRLHFIFGHSINYDYSKTNRLRLPHVWSPIALRLKYPPKSKRILFSFPCINHRTNCNAFPKHMIGRFVFNMLFLFRYRKYSHYV